MRDKEQHARAVLGGRVRELEQASKELVETLGALDPSDPIFEAMAQHPEIAAAMERCREKLRLKSDAFKQWRDSLSKGAW